MSCYCFLLADMVRALRSYRHSLEIAWHHYVEATARSNCGTNFASQCFATACNIDKSQLAWFRRQKSYHMGLDLASERTALAIYGAPSSL